MSKTYLFIIVTLLCSLDVNSKQVVMLFGHSLEPYVIEKENKGAELVIFKEALKYQGHELIPLYTDLGKVSSLYELEAIDAVQRFIAPKGQVAKGFYGDISISYHDTFFTLEDRDIVINSPKDLNKHSIIAFQGADKHYADWLTDYSSYSETSKQLTQVKMLQMGLVDVVLSDRYIFNYNVQQYQQLTDSKIIPMRLHNFVSPYKYRPLFKSEKIALDFNKGLQKLKDSGRYQEILSQFAKQAIYIEKELTVLKQ